MDKLKSLPALKKIVEKIKKRRKTIVFTNGCFDLLHPGHIKIFQQAKKKGDILIVGLNSDCSVKKIKGEQRPILNEKARSFILSSLEDVDYIVLFDEDTPYRVIKTLAPDYLVKGGDWKLSEIIGREFVKKVFRVKLSPGYSTSGIIEKIETGARQQYF